MSKPVSRYYIRQLEHGAWGVYRYHPHKGETRPPEKRRPFIIARPLARAWARLDARLKGYAK